MINQVFDGLSKLLSKKEIERIALATGFIKRSSSKITGFDFLISLLTSSTYGSHSTLEKLAGILMYVSHKIQISAQALMNRINTKTSVCFLEAVHARLFNAKLDEFQKVPAELLAQFTKVFLQDSSSIILDEKLQEYFKGSGGRSSKSSAKFDVIYEWKSKKYEQILLTDQKEADQKLGLKIESVVTENSLTIRDLGYLRVDGLMKIISKKAFYLSRLRSDILVFLNKDDEDPTDILEYVGKKLRNGCCLDLQVYITTEKLPVRLIVYRAPEEVANKRKRLASTTAKKQGRQLRDKTLKFMDYTMFITNVSIEIWKPEVIGTIYRIRWQIELIFKCWKSQLEIQYLKGINPERIRSLIYAKLILILLINQIYRLAEYIGTKHLKRIVSMYKVYEWVRDVDRVIKIVKGTMTKWEKKSFTQAVFMSMCMQQRKRKTTLQRVCEGEFYYAKSELG